MSTILELYLVFLKFGFCSFGGLSMIPVINQEMVNHGWMTLEEAHAYAPSCMGFPCRLPISAAAWNPGVSCLRFVSFVSRALYGIILA